MSPIYEAHSPTRQRTLRCISNPPCQAPGTDGDLGVCTSVRRLRLYSWCRSRGNLRILGFGPWPVGAGVMWSNLSTNCSLLWNLGATDSAWRVTKQQLLETGRRWCGMGWRDG